MWDWRTGTLLAKQPLHAECSGLCFTEDGGSIVTTGKEHFKVWGITQQQLQRGARGGGSGALALAPKQACLKEFKSCTFVDAKPAVSASQVAASAAGVYALTSSGVLVLMRPAGKTIDKSVNLQVPSAFALAVAPGVVACACAGAVVRVFAAKTLAFKLNVPRPEVGDKAPSDGEKGAGKVRVVSLPFFPLCAAVCSASW